MKTFSIVPHRKFYLAVSGVLILVSAAMIVVFWLNLGIDFTGGSLIEIRFIGDAPEHTEIAETIGSIVDAGVTVQDIGPKTVIARFPDVTENVHQEALSSLVEKYGEIEELRFDSIGPTIGAELKKSGIIAVIVGLIAIMLFVAYAFRGASKPVASWQYGIITSFVALFHDVLITLGVFAVLGRFAGVEVNTPFVAALLTVLGYSVNDTIVIFDRVRENLRRYAGDAFGEIVERSLHETFGRSLNTSLTLLFAVGAVWWFGSSTVRPFALALFVGVAVGTYSSLFLASNLLVVLEEFLSRRRGSA